MTIFYQDFIYKSAHSEFMKQGYSDRDSSNVAPEVVRKHRRGKTFKQAMAEAFDAGKRSCKKVKS
jgi:hypothetical protein